MSYIVANKEVRLDAEDAELLHLYSWTVQEGYVTTSVYRSGQNPRTLKLHRLILNAGPGTIVDHINGNKLDNRKINLRFCTALGNARNKNPQRNKVSSVFKGVTWHSKSKKWRVRIRVLGKLVSRGLFAKEEDAARAYDKAALEFFQEYARLNFPDGGTT